MAIHIGYIIFDSFESIISKNWFIGISIPPNTIVFPTRCWAHAMAVSIIFSPVRIHPINHFDDHIEAEPNNHIKLCVNRVFNLFFSLFTAMNTTNGNPKVRIGVVRKSI